VPFAHGHVIQAKDPSKAAYFNTEAFEEMGEFAIGELPGSTNVFFAVFHTPCR
jgi:hypothetical protein